MELFIDKDSLNGIITSLEQEIEQFKINIDNIYKEIDSLHIYWSGTTYQAFMKEVSKNRNAIENAYLALEEYHCLIQDSLDNFCKLEEGVHYNE